MIALYRQTCPLPTVSPEGELVNGLTLAQPNKCKKCVSKSCASTNGQKTISTSFHVCEFGLSYAIIPTPFGALVVNGIYVPEENSSLDSEKRKLFRPQKVSKATVLRYSDAINGTGDIVKHAIELEARDSIAGFHDIKTATNLLFRNAEAILDDQLGDTFEEKANSLDPKMKTLLFSVRLLSSRLEMATIVANPESASYGQPRSVPVFKTFHRYVRIFEEEAAKRGIRLFMSGASFNRPRLFDSFDTIPLVLIDNAIKYSFQDHDIAVRVNDLPNGGCRVSVSSEGVIIPQKYRGQIFSRGFRSPFAKETVSNGSGLGLYIAEIVAKANSFTILYEAYPKFNRPDEGENRFSFDISPR